MKLVIATRRSRLALWQAGHIKQRLEMLHPGLSVALLALFFDAEARIETRVSGERYRIEIEIPYRPGPA